MGVSSLGLGSIYIFYAVSFYGFTKAKRNNNDNSSMDMTVETPSAQVR